MKRLAILGASGHGKVVADAAAAAGWDETVFYDDAWPRRRTNGPWAVVGDTAVLVDQLDEHDGVIVGIGDNRTRLDLAHRLTKSNARLVSVIHPQAVVSRYAEIGDGTVVFAGVVVNVDSRVGRGCIINTGATVDHDCALADGVHLSPGAHLAGGVTVGEASWVGIGASVRQRVTVDRDVTVGAGAVVVSHVPAGQTVVGVPAKPLAAE
ncbi:MAG TPA: NeuD/PglB/VioB family sugar acetyltransferase [Acidimicrobiales bacterium]